jgi:catechol 2,3-dioxygenase-like lactoylglutathione lyase family enzyme
MGEIALKSISDPVRSGRICERSILQNKLGFEIDFLYGAPPFMVRFARRSLPAPSMRPPAGFAELAAREGLLDPSHRRGFRRSLFEEFKERGIEFAQMPTKQPWGGTDFLVRDPDGNVVSFVTYG